MRNSLQSKIQKLNPEQREAVLHDRGPLLILAGAGSGKTNTMATRIGYLISEKHVPPASILGLSFTRKAAQELKTRVFSLLEHLTLEEEPFLGTFHSLAVSILRQNSELSGRTRYFGILTQNDQIEIIKDCLKVLKIDDKKFDVHQILFELTLCKSYLLTHSFESLEDHLLHQRRLNHDTAAIITALYDRYQTQLRTQNAFDFEDLLVECVRVFETHPHLAQQYSQRYQYLLVDEYQDTNSIQFKLLKHLTTTHDNLCVVGDDDQSIYSWRGADPTHILGFKQSFPKAKVITLSQNYRSHQQILNAAHDVIQHNKKRHAKKLWSSRKEGEILQSVLLEDDAAEAEWVADTLLKHHQDYQLPFHEFAILYRSNPQSRIFEEKLRSRQIPYKIVGTLSFLERKEIKNILAYIQVILNPHHDMSLRRILNWPPRSISKTTIEDWNHHQLHHPEQPSFYTILKTTPVATDRRHADKIQQSLDQFLNWIETKQNELKALAPSSESLAQYLLHTLKELKILDTLQKEEDLDTAQKKWENIEELVHSIGRLKFKSKKDTAQSILQDYMTQMTLEATQEEEDLKNDSEQKNQVTLLTLHGSKGLEFNTVFMVGMEEGLLPHRRTLEGMEDLSEERRLCYVGITRAKNHLFLTRTKNRIRYGKSVPREASRFLADISPEWIQFMDYSLSPAESHQARVKKHEERVKSFTSGILDSLKKSDKKS